jgi:hypothetical protein
MAGVVQKVLFLGNTGEGITAPKWAKSDFTMLI